MYRNSVCKWSYEKAAGLLNEEELTTNSVKTVGLIFSLLLDQQARAVEHHLQSRVDPQGSDVRHSVNIPND